MKPYVWATTLCVGSTTLACGVFDVPLHSEDASVPVAECATNVECTNRATAAAGTLTPAVCSKPDYKCVQLLSEDCETITGNYSDDNAILLGSILAIKGAQAPANTQRQEAAILAVNEINDVGGVPGRTVSERRPLVLVSCNSTEDAVRAGRHLAEELHVAGIVGPNLSQDTINVTNEVTAAARVVMMSPTAVASSIADLMDNGMTFQMVANDNQRAPLLIQQINALETQLRTERSKQYIKLAVVYRDDAFGIGTRISIGSLMINGAALADPINLGNNVRLDGYNPSAQNQDALVDELRTFAPDIVALAGTTEIVTQIITPLETRWNAGNDRPYYVGHDGSKVPDFLSTVTGNDPFRRRVRGVGVVPPTSTTDVFDAFKVDYSLHYPGKSVNTSGMGSCYDAVYSMAFALASSKDVDASGTAIVAGLAKLSGGPMTVRLGPTTILSAFQELSRGESITALGTFGPLEWAGDGSSAGGAVSVWCIGVPSATPVYQESGLRFDIKLQQFEGAYTPCAP